MKEGSISEGTESSTTYEMLKTIVRGKVQEFIQRILEEEVSDLENLAPCNLTNLCTLCTRMFWIRRQLQHKAERVWARST